MQTEPPVKGFFKKSCFCWNMRFWDIPAREARIAEPGDGTAGFAFGSGMAAVTAVLPGAKRGARALPPETLK